MSKFFTITISAFLVLSCTSEKPAATRDIASSGAAAGVAMPVKQSEPGDVYSCAVELYPKAATCKTTLSLIATGFNPSDAKIEWLLNGSPFTPLIPSRFSGADARKGDTIQVRVFVRDLDVMSDAVLIMNAPPEIARIKILPEVFRPGDTLSVEVEGQDVDGDAVSLLYEWDKNGDAAGKGPGIETALKRGDRISVKVTPFDGETYGVPVVLHREIQNLPPAIAEHSEFAFDGKVYAYQVKAADLDGDALSYSLEGAPNGMSVDKATGLIRWPVPPEFKGAAGATAVVSDGHGGIARYQLTITIK